jgi:hypothetical protein
MVTGTTEEVHENRHTKDKGGNGESSRNAERFYENIGNTTNGQGTQARY